VIYRCQCCSIFLALTVDTAADWCNDCSSAYRGDAMGATENVGFSATVQRYLGRDFVTKQHKSLQRLQPVAA